MSCIDLHCIDGYLFDRKWNNSVSYGREAIISQLDYKSMAVLKEQIPEQLI